MSDSYDHIKSIAEDFKPTPPPMAWDRINNNISHSESLNVNRRRSSIKFWFTIAASMMIIVTCAYVIYQESISRQTYGVDYVAEWEDLDIKRDYFYSIENARLLNEISPFTYQN